MNQPPEQIAAFHTNHRERVGPNRAPLVPSHQLSLFELGPRDWVSSKSADVPDTETRAGEYSEGHNALGYKRFDPHNSGGQLAMFMTPNEIKEHYTPLEGDRESRDEWYDNDISSSSSSSGSTQDSGHDAFGGVETDEELWDRKEDEAMYQGLHESIAKHGVLSPVQLAFSNKPGPRGIPEVLGGHHRIAAAPGNQLIPVEHYANIGAARADKYSPYERSVKDVDPDYEHHSEPDEQSRIADEHGIDLGYRHHQSAAGSSEGFW